MKLKHSLSTYSNVVIVFLLLTLCACGTPGGGTVTGEMPGPASSGTAARETPKPAAGGTLTSEAAAQPPRPTLRFRTPTPPPNPGTIIRDDGPFRLLSHPSFYWTVKLPRDWVITYDRGFEVLANHPQQTAFLRLFSQAWGSESERRASARDYVNYWKTHPYGNLFPVYARGSLVAETEIGQDKFGGPYLRYEFNDGKKGVRYLQVYASGGGPNSLVLTLWAKDADFGQVKDVFESILQSLALLKPE